MEQINHADMVKQLAKPGADILASLTPSKVHLLHMVIGISGEVAEYTVSDSIENALEEMGDIQFYFEGLRQGLDIELEATVAMIAIGVKNEGTLVSVAGDVLDYVKKYVVYNKPFEEVEQKLLMSMAMFEFLLNRELGYLGFTKAQALDANIDKLGDRYKGHNYSDQAAQDRADKKGEENPDIADGLECQTC